MTGRTQLGVLDFLESHTESSSPEIAKALGEQRHRISAVMNNLERQCLVVRTREVGRSNNRTIFWRLATDDEILHPPKRGKPEFPENWPRVDRLLYDCMLNMVRAS
ncbi:MarR family transcriptional regulator [Pararobbsia alpina]|uniref:MarR family transcriptional regulator n=1 Tax=Pararobbsia alpina TaxID=621374 RepID=UPI0039A6710C